MSRLKERTLHGFIGFVRDKRQLGLIKERPIIFELKCDQHSDLVLSEMVALLILKAK
jgi:hypothetical protein